MTRCRRLEREDRQLTVWLTRRRRSTIDWNVEDSREKIDYWRIDRVLIFHHDWLTDIQNRKINYWLSFSQTHDHSRWLTMRQVKVKYIHRPQRRNFFILADSRSFSLTHDAHNENEVHSSSAKTELRRLSLSKNFDLTILFCLLAYLDEQSIWDRKFDRMSVSLAEFWARDLAVLKTWRWSRHRHCSW